MKLSELGELSLLKTIRRRFTVNNKDVVVGIGDDTAVEKPSGNNLLATTDMMVEGIHFDLNLITPYQLGFKLVSVNVSDIYAMGGRPQYLLLDIALNKNTEQSFVNRLFDGHTPCNETIRSLSHRRRHFFLKERYSHCSNPHRRCEKAYKTLRGKTR